MMIGNVDVEKSVAAVFFDDAIDRTARIPKIFLTDTLAQCKLGEYKANINMVRSEILLDNSEEGKHAGTIPGCAPRGAQITGLMRPEDTMSWSA